MTTQVQAFARQRPTRTERSAVIKRSVVVGGHKTSVSLEDAFWHYLKDIAKSRRMTLADMIDFIDEQGRPGNLSSRIRMFVLEQAREERNLAAGIVAGPRNQSQPPAL